MVSNYKKRIELFLLALLFVGIGGYGYLRARDLIVGVTIKVAGITDGESVHDPYLAVSGTAQRASILTINGAPIDIDQSGNFHDDRTLSPGYNVLTFHAADKFGKETTKTYRVMVLE